MIQKRKKQYLGVLQIIYSNGLELVEIEEETINEADRYRVTNAHAKRNKLLVMLNPLVRIGNICFELEFRIAQQSEIVSMPGENKILLSQAQ